MENGGKLKTENNVYNEAYVDSNFDAQSKRKVSEFNLSSFYNDRSSTFSKKVFVRDITVIHTNA